MYPLSSVCTKYGEPKLYSNKLEAHPTEHVSLT